MNKGGTLIDLFSLNVQYAWNNLTHAMKGQFTIFVLNINDRFILYFPYDKNLRFDDNAYEVVLSFLL
ncbi:MAG: hypothetical protein ACTS8P_01580 [Arsenophonus sp. NC-XBC3-MAG3]